jgi:hypothetical protein
VVNGEPDAGGFGELVGFMTPGATQAPTSANLRKWLLVIGLLRSVILAP